VGFLDYVWLGIMEALTANPMFMLGDIVISTTVVMVLSGFLTGIIVGATPGLSGPFAMAVALPILISVFGVTQDALLPVMGFLVGVMKGATIGGSVPAILFNTPGTPDAFLTTFDGYPMTRKGQSGKALRVAHFSSASGDTFSDLVLFTTAPFLAVMVERYLDFPEKAALILLSLSFISAVVGKSIVKGMFAAIFGMFLATIGTGDDMYPRLTFGLELLSEGFPLVSAVLGVLILGEVFKAMEDMMRERKQSASVTQIELKGDNKLRLADIRRILPFVGQSAVVGTMIGALPGIGSTLAATMGYSMARNVSKEPEKFGTGVPEGIAATEAANSSVAGANLIPVLSLGIPGNVAAVFLILATESIGNFNPGPQVFQFDPNVVNMEAVLAFGLFTAMALANIFNWTIGGVFMRMTSVMIRIPKQYLIPAVLLLTLTSIYVENTSMSAVYIAVGFGFLGYIMRKLEISVLPFVIAYILAENLEFVIRQAFSVSGSDPWFFFKSPIAMIFLGLIFVVIYFFGIRAKRRDREIEARKASNN